MEEQEQNGGKGAELRIGRSWRSRILGRMEGAESGQMEEQERNQEQNGEKRADPAEL